MQPPFFYDLDDDKQELMLEVALGNRGVVVSRLNGMCGDIFIFDQGERVFPRYVCAKVPRKHRTASIEEVNKRFVEELDLQLRFSQHSLVHWCFDLREVLGAPVALFRYWDGDLRNYMAGNSDITKLSLIAYCCSGLMHCYARGLVAHQDLKPANIFVRNFRKGSSELPDLDIYQVALIADFGLANACIKVPAVFEGSRPYMAPEQWNKSQLSEKTDVFALGVILHELMTEGFHPAGVRTEEVWPSAIPGNSTKWTRSESWKKWIARNCPLEAPVELSADVMILIERTLSIDPGSRPGMAELKDLILDLINLRCGQAHLQLEALIKHFDNNASKGSLEDEWPYVANVWQHFQKRFG
ncbi:serine/threonine protein kinase [Pseudomonas putida]|uniref:Protein kinase n=1 Tax=Pseudomonas putida TaxID=303 RepID=A0ABD7BK96_PSEPU|nr:protein kinase [Pseudomonas putida]QOD00758.1 protein kinase [Pseudomonas putida]